jgi:peptidoglycan-associated lipoprotein
MSRTALLLDIKMEDIMFKFNCTHLVIFSFVIAAAVGCAKQELVKKEEPIAPISPMKHTANKVSGELKNTHNSITGTQMATKDSNKEEPIDSLTPILNAAELKPMLEIIYFDFDSATLSPVAREILEKNATIMKDDPAVTVRIEGHCDERGSDEYNLALGEKRAKAAAKYLAALGVAEKRIGTISYGKEKPAESGHDEAAWAKNRRDQFVLQSK